MDLASQDNLSQSRLSPAPRATPRAAAGTGPSRQGRIWAASARALDHADGIALITLGPDGRVTGWNRGAQELFGYGTGEILGRPGEVLLPADDTPDDMPLRSLRDAVAAGGWFRGRDGRRIWATGTCTPLQQQDGRAQGWLCLLHDETAAADERYRREQVLGGMNHRMHNMLATLQAVAVQTLRHTDTRDVFQDGLSARIASFGRAYDVLAQGGWENAPLDALIEAVVGRYAGHRLEMSGPPLKLAAGMVMTFALVMNELAANAARYGALSEPQGRVSIQWGFLPAWQGVRRLEIVWRELDGPLVHWPARRGFGMQMLDQGQLPGGGSTKLQFRNDGVECRIGLPLIPGVLEQ